MKLIITNTSNESSSHISSEQGAVVTSLINKEINVTSENIIPGSYQGKLEVRTDKDGNQIIEFVPDEPKTFIEVLERMNATEINMLNNKAHAAKEALHKLMIVARHVNGPNWYPHSAKGNKYFLLWDAQGEICVNKHQLVRYGMVYFITKEAAARAAQIVGHNTVRQALSLNI